MVIASSILPNRRTAALGTSRAVEPADSRDPGRSAQPAAWVDPAYDAAGNMTECPKAGTLADGAAKLKHTWDAWNRLVKVQDAYDCTVAEYQYDGLGRRIAKLRPWLKLTVEGTPEGPDGLYVGDAVTDGANGTGVVAWIGCGGYWFIEVTGSTTWAASGTITKGQNTLDYTSKVEAWRRWDYYYNEDLGLRSLGGAGWQCLEECYHPDLPEQDKGVVSQSPYVHYLWDIRYIDAPVCRWWDSDGDGTLTDETALYCCNDANMNVTALVGADGTAVERYMYDPYGRVTFLDASFSPRTNNRSDYENEILYCGYRFDPETGDYQCRERTYQPTLGVFLSRDALASTAAHPSEYVAGKPLDYLDPLGLYVFSTASERQPIQTPGSQPERTWDDKVIAALQNLCPCVVLDPTERGASFNSTDLAENLGKAGYSASGNGRTGIRIKAKRIVNDTLENFCKCLEKNPGCRLIHDLLVTSDYILIDYRDGANGGWSRYGNVHRIDFSPDWKGDRTNVNKKIADWQDLTKDEGATVVLAEELGHAWDHLIDHPMKNKPAGPSNDRQKELLGMQISNQVGKALYGNRYNSVTKHRAPKAGQPDWVFGAEAEKARLPKITEQDGQEYWKALEDGQMWGSAKKQ